MNTKFGTQIRLSKAGALLAVAIPLGGFASNPTYDQRLTEQLAGWDPTQLDAFHVYYQGSVSQPKAVLLDEAGDDVRFIERSWKRAQSQQVALLTRSALERGLKAAQLSDRGDQTIGYLIARPRDDSRGDTFYQVNLAESSNEVRTFQVQRRFRRDRGGGP